MNWDEFVQKYQKPLNFVASTAEKGCPLCKFKPERWASFEFHMSSTHGIPRDILIAAMGL